ncbi:uncharacterized protein LOC106005220 isoform X2 [Mustela putorius furo]|uniref:Uncharacterized protein LOC106005220 isoform X2 n=1 Tax=Mustela putorius furo TaxID=9669 RepID=A0A8U0S9R7_MUSPF|nr:uncharacterized protein LOC106005220 isoform X2 [Mustela putorius furo]
MCSGTCSGHPCLQQWGLRPNTGQKEQDAPGGLRECAPPQWSDHRRGHLPPLRMVLTVETRDNSLWDRPAPACELRSVSPTTHELQMHPDSSLGWRQPPATCSTCPCLSLGSYFDHDAWAREGVGPFCELGKEKHEGSKLPLKGLHHRDGRSRPRAGGVKAWKPQTLPGSGRSLNGALWVCVPGSACTYPALELPG